MRQSEPRIYKKSWREIRRSFPARNGHKSNRMTRDMLAATAGFINAVGGVNGDVPTELTRSDVDTIIATLADNNAYRIMDMIEGEDRFGTAPVRDAYFALGSTQLIGNLENVAGFTAQSQYPNQANVLRSEWGAISNLRFLLSSIGSQSLNASSLGNTVYNIFCVGMEAYSFIEQDGYNASFIYRPPIYSDPLAQNASAAYKFGACPRILN